MSALIAYIRSHGTESRPLLPAAWDYTTEADRWCSVYPLGRESNPGVIFHARLAVRDPSFPATRALFVCTGPAAVLQALADRVASDALPWTLTWPTLVAFRAELSAAAAIRLRGAWPDERAIDGASQPMGALVAHWRRMAGLAAEGAES